MVPAINKALHDRGLEFAIPDSTPFISLQAGGILFILLAMQQWLQHRTQGHQGGHPMPSDPSNPTPPQINIGTNQGQVAGVNQGIMHQEVHHHAPPRRTLVGLDVEKMRQRLSAYSVPKMVVACGMGDGEALGFAAEIKALLTSAGWNVPDGIHQRIYQGAPEPGVVVSFREENDLAMRELVVILRETPYQTIGEYGHPGPDPTIFVGPRP